MVQLAKKTTTLLVILLHLYKCNGQEPQLAKKEMFEIDETFHVFQGGIPIKYLNDSLLILDDGPANVFTLFNVKNGSIQSLFNLDVLDKDLLFRNLRSIYPELRFIKPDSLVSIMKQEIHFIDKFDVSTDLQFIYVCFFYEGFYYDENETLQHHPFKFVAKFNTDMELINLKPILYPNVRDAINKRVFPYPDIQGGYYLENDFLLVKNGPALEGFDYFKTPYLIRYKADSIGYTFDEVVEYYPDSSFEPFDFDTYDMTRILIRKYGNKLIFNNLNSIQDQNNNILYKSENSNLYILDCYMNADRLVFYAMEYMSEQNKYAHTIYYTDLTTGRIYQLEIPENEANSIRSATVFGNNVYCVSFTKENRYVLHYTF